MLNCAQHAYSQAPAAQRRSIKNLSSLCAVLVLSLIRSDAANAAGDKTIQRRRRSPVRRCTALCETDETLKR